MNSKDEYDHKSINSPFRWAGGKFYARKIIEKYIPKHDFYVEPFLGGGSVFFHKNKVNSWLNDYEKDLINCYKVIKSNLSDLLDKLKNEKATKERHRWFKNEFSPKTKIEQAFKYYYLNRTSYSGIMKRENCFFGYGEKYSMRPENWPRQLEKNSKKLQKVKITNFDFEKVINNIKTKNTFVFLDPPYFNADQNKFYTKSFGVQDHIRLCKILKKNNNKFKFLLTYDNCEEIREMYKWAKFSDSQEWNYVIARTDNQKEKKKLKDGFSRPRSKGKEIFIYNYSIKDESKQLKLT